MFDYRILWEVIVRLFHQVLPSTWRADALRSLGSFLGQIPTLVFFYPLVFWSDTAEATLAPLVLVPALIAFVARFLPGAAGVLFATGLGALGTVPHAVLNDWGPERYALMAAGALAGLLVLAAVRWRVRLLGLGLLVAAGLLAVGVLAEIPECLAVSSVLLAAVGAGSGARLLDRASVLTVAKPNVDLELTTRGSRSLRRAIPAVLAVLPLAGVAAALPGSTGLRVAYGGACALLALGPALVAWASDEESTLRSALIASFVGALCLGLFALLQASVWATLIESGGGQFDALAESAKGLRAHAGPLAVFALTFAASATTLSAARLKRREPLLSIVPALVVGVCVLCVVLYEHTTNTYATWRSYRLIAPVVSFAWLLGLGGLETGDRWLGKLADRTRRERKALTQWP